MKFILQNTNLYMRSPKISFPEYTQSATQYFIKLLVNPLKIHPTFIFYSQSIVGN